MAVTVMTKDSTMTPSTSSSSRRQQQQRRRDRLSAGTPKSNRSSNNRNSILTLVVFVSSAIVCIVFTVSSLSESSSIVVPNEITDFLLSSPMLWNGTLLSSTGPSVTATMMRGRSMTETTTFLSSSSSTGAGSDHDDATGTGRRGVKLCPHVLSLYGLDKNYDDQGQQQQQQQQQAQQLQIVKQQLLDSVQDATKFHAYGGSLKSVQKFLDGQIDETLAKLGIDYEATAETETTTPAGSTKVTATQYLKEYYKTHDVPRGGYGQPLPIKYVDKRLAQVPAAPAEQAQQQGRNLQQDDRKNSNNYDIVKSALAGERWIDVMERWSNDRYRVSVGPDLNPTCPNIVSFSKGTYEEKKFCVIQDNNINNNNNKSLDHHQLQHEEECHIFSIGSNDQWGFEEDVIKLAQTKGCHTHTFDCTLAGPPKNQPNDDRVHFYSYCIGSSYHVDVPTDEKAQKINFLPYSELWNVTGISSAPKLLKMDVEGFEFDVLTSMFSNAPPSTWPEQIMMEVHFGTRMVDVEWMLRTRQTAEIAMFFDILWNVGGYMPVTRKYFRKCATCLEILMMRVNCS